MQPLAARRNNFKLPAALVNPGSQSNEVLDGEFFHRLLNFLDVAHVPSPTKDSTPFHGSTLRVFEPSPAITNVIGIVHGYPPDLAKNHDHYLYGMPKKASNRP